MPWQPTCLALADMQLICHPAPRAELVCACCLVSFGASRKKGSFRTAACIITQALVSTSHISEGGQRNLSNRVAKSDEWIRNSLNYMLILIHAPLPTC